MKKILILLSMLCFGAYAEQITINWLNADRTINNTTTCTIGGDVNVPIPTKYGYTFQGYTDACSNITDYGDNPEYNAQKCRWKALNYPNSSSFTMTSIFGIENNEDLDIGQWAATYSNATIKGKVLCSATPRSGVTPKENSNGLYCWCKATDVYYNNGFRCNNISGLYVYIGDYSNYGWCQTVCAQRCAMGMVNSDRIKETLGITNL